MSSKEELMKRLGIDIDSETFRLAFTHRSYSYENGGIPTNERLEFLGDSILGFCVAEYLYATFPDLPEGDLAKRRAAIVSTRALAIIARDLQVGEHLLLGRGEAQSNGANKSSILADTMEAILGATYLVQGMDAARAFVLRFVTPLLEDPRLVGATTDWKTVIQEVVASQKMGELRYDVAGSGPDHARTYVATLCIAEKGYGEGHGPSKKEAEQEAAHQTWLQFNPGEQVPKR
ncbi:ribonuclease III [Glutamicibacter sp. M10]|nr:ribonuclease III [Glutamicibacter sp. M10]UXN31243.1 ribonuclease III [Glutamicibacter sp. M10]